MFLAVSSLDVPPERQSDLEAAFENRSKLVDDHEGFCRLQLVKRTNADEYLLFVWWDSQEDFKRYVQHPDFDHAHGDLDEAVTPGPLHQFETVLDSEQDG